MTFVFSSVDWTPEDGYPPGASYDSLPWRPTGVGSHQGLTIALDSDTEEYYCSSESSIGFKVLNMAESNHEN